MNDFLHGNIACRHCDKYLGNCSVACCLCGDQGDEDDKNRFRGRSQCLRWYRRHFWLRFASDVIQTVSSLCTPRWRRQRVWNPNMFQVFQVFQMDWIHSTCYWPDCHPGSLQTKRKELAPLPERLDASMCVLETRLKRLKFREGKMWQG